MAAMALTHYLILLPQSFARAAARRLISLMVSMESVGSQLTAGMRQLASGRIDTSGFG
jgi:hypothetical protein